MLISKLKHKSLVPVVVAAFLLRIVVMFFLIPERLNPTRDHYEYAFEHGRVARSIALGKGMQDPLVGVQGPLLGKTGPTALVAPLYPLLLAGIFKVFGIYTTASAIVSLSLNCLLSALTAIPIFFIARMQFGERAARWASWLWAFFPYAIYFSADWIWPTCLTTLLLSCMVLLVLRLQDPAPRSYWLLLAFLCGIAALNDSTILSVVPLLALWSCYRLVVQGHRFPWKSMVLGLLLFVSILSPWWIRNYRVFHAFVPLRSGIGLELFIGNDGYDAHWAHSKTRPANNPDEIRQYEHLGEVRYMQEKSKQALGFVAGHPGWYATHCFKRLVYLWTGYWSLDAAYLKGEPLDPWNIPVATTISALAIFGLYRTLRSDRSRGMPFLIILVFFPLVYYLTHPEVYYMRPIDPFLVILATTVLIKRDDAGSPRDLVLADSEVLTTA